MLGFAAFFTYGGKVGADSGVSVVPCSAWRGIVFRGRNGSNSASRPSPVALAGLLLCVVSLAALAGLSGGSVSAATPASVGDFFLLTANGVAAGLSQARLHHNSGFAADSTLSTDPPMSQVLLLAGSRTAPAAEVSLMSLLETGLSPVLVYLVTLSQAVPEVPDAYTIAAGGLIIATLAAHTLYDSRRAGTAAGDASEAVSLSAVRSGDDVAAKLKLEEGGGGGGDGAACCSAPAEDSAAGATKILGSRTPNEDAPATET